MSRVIVVNFEFDIQIRKIAIDSKTRKDALKHICTYKTTNTRVRKTIINIKTNYYIYVYKEVALGCGFTENPLLVYRLQENLWMCKILIVIPFWNVIPKLS